MMRRYLALWFPTLPIDRVRRRGLPKGSGAPGEPLVVLGRLDSALRIVAVDRRAADLGLGRGLTLAEARARIPDLASIEADPAADALFLERLAGACEIFTPLVARDGADGLMLDVTGCAHLFGGEAGLVEAAKRRMRRIGLDVGAVVAGTPDAARAFVRAGIDGIVAPGAEAATARDLPVAALEASAEATIALRRAGLERLGDLASRPSTVLAARFGQGLTTRLGRILGREDVRVTPLRPPPDCLVERHFAEPMTQGAAIEGVVEDLARSIEAALEARGAGGRRFEVSLFRVDGAVRRLAVETGRACRDADAVARLFRLRLDALADPIDPGYGYDAIRLAVPALEPMGALQHDFDRKGVEEADLADLVDRLVARFGPERVLRFVARDTHHPVRAAAAVPATRDAASAPWVEPEPGAPPTRPLRLFEPPQPIETLAEVPDGPPLRFRWRRVLHEIARAEGPERIAPEWWRDGPEEETRDYYRVEDAQGRRFWVFREGFWGEGEAHPRWYLQGLFA